MAFVQPLLLGRRRLNPEWIAKHYDSENMQLFAADEAYNVYTPGVYLNEDDSLEEGAERKLEYAFESLGLRAGESLLDVYEPGSPFDAISLRGSIEDLSDYDEVMTRLAAWLRPGGTVYLDFAAVDRRFGVPSFITKYVWPGAFRMVYLPSFTRALAKHHFDIVEMRNDRRNYHLWVRGGYERWMRRREEIVEAVGETTWRMMRLLMAGTAHVMSERSTRATAYRVVLQPRAPARVGARDRGEASLAPGSPP